MERDFQKKGRVDRHKKEKEVLPSEKKRKGGMGLGGGRPVFSKKKIEKVSGKSKKRGEVKQ